MATGDILLHKASAFGEAGAIKYKTAASATLIYPGEPVTKTLGGYVVAKMATNKPDASSTTTELLVGIATTTSTNTAALAGEVWVQPILPGVIYKMKPNVAATWDTQAEYDLLVGDRVLMDYTSPSYTILAADSANNGCVIEWIDVAKNPGYVAFSFRAASLAGK
jgi:hypothetical protein